MTVHFFAQAADWCSCPSIDIPMASQDAGPTTTLTLRQTLAGLAERFGQPFKEHIFDPMTLTIQEDCFILVNGVHLARIPDGPDMILDDQDTVAIASRVDAG